MNIHDQINEKKESVEIVCMADRCIPDMKTMTQNISPNINCSSVGFDKIIFK